MANDPIKLVDVGALDRFKTDIENEIPDSVQYSTMPTASADLVGKIVQYTGEDASGLGYDLINGHWYKCESWGTGYIWTDLYTDSISNSSKPVISSAVSSALQAKQNIIQVAEMPTASSTRVGDILQYIGTTTASYTNGYFYKCVPGSTSGTYEWAPVEVQEDSSISSTSTTSPLTDSADGYVQGVTVKGHSEVVDGAIKSIGDAGWGVVDLGTLTWVKGYASIFYVSFAAMANNKGGVCAKYEAVLYYSSLLSHDKCFVKDANGNLYIKDTEYENSDAAAFKSAMSSVLLYYPLADTTGATPTLGITSKDGAGQGTAATITTGLPLRSVSDSITDEVDNEKVVTRCNEIDLGSLHWEIYSSANKIFYSDAISDATNGVCISTKYTYSSVSAPASLEDNSYILYTNKRLYIRDTNYADATTFATSLSGEKLVYQLEIPVETPLTSAEKSALASLRTYDHTTYIDVTDAPTMTVDYLLNTNNGKAVADIQMDLQGQIDEVKNATKSRVYAFYVNQNDSNPATCVHPYYNAKYGCDNLFYQNAYMDYEKDEFNYGSWKEFIYEFFKPCMLDYDGHVDYYLDPDDYETKLDGGTSDIKDMTYNGNVMVQIKTLYFKRWTTGGKYYCIISDKKLDKSFKAYAHHDIKGNVLDYIYRAAYDGSYDGTRLRSISGIDYHNVNVLTVNKIMSNTTRQQEIDFAKANNDANEQGEGWNILHKAEWDLINDLLLLIGMSTNTQATFGNGNISSYVSVSNTGIIATGTMDKKGLFYGKNDNVSGVKVFGIEMPWGNIWKSCLGWILSANQYLVKMTPGNEDGSTATGYNLDGTGYVATGKSIAANGYISAFDGADTGFLPTAASGSATTYMCDHVWQNTAVYYALVGGFSGDGARCGAFCAVLNVSAALAYWYFGAALSYKSLK